MGRIRLHVALDFSAYSLETFLLDSIEPGSMIATDALQSYNCIAPNPYGHGKTNQSKTTDKENLYGVHLVTTLFKRFIRGTFQGRLEPKYIQNYLDEFTFRFNRRKSKSVGKKFMRIVQQAVNSAKVTYKEIMWDMRTCCKCFNRVRRGWRRLFHHHHPEEELTGTKVPSGARSLPRGPISIQHWFFQFGVMHK